VLSLPSAKRQAVLESAEREQWSVRQLRQKVLLARRPEGERRGRTDASTEGRSLPALRGAVRALHDSVEEIEQIGRRGALGGAMRGEIGRICGEIGRIASRLSPFGRMPRTEPRAERPVDAPVTGRE
jgi:hypothetical protein